MTGVRAARYGSTSTSSRRRSWSWRAGPDLRSAADVSLSFPPFPPRGREGRVSPGSKWVCEWLCHPAHVAMPLIHVGLSVFWWSVGGACSFSFSRW